MEKKCILEFFATLAIINRTLTFMMLDQQLICSEASPRDKKKNPDTLSLQIIKSIKVLMFWGYKIGENIWLLYLMV